MTEGKIVDTFDGVLLEEVQELPIQLRMHVYSLVASTREVQLSHSGSLDKLGKHCVSPYLRFSLRLTLEFLFELPLNLVPLIGPPLFIMLQGVPLSPSSFFEAYANFSRLSSRPPRTLSLYPAQRLVRDAEEEVHKLESLAVLAIWACPCLFADHPGAEHFLPIYVCRGCGAVGYRGSEEAVLWNQRTCVCEY